MTRRITRMGIQLSIALGLCISGSAQAQLGPDANWGTNATTFNLNCISADCSGGGVSGGDSGSGVADDNVQGNPASSSISNSLGTSNITADFTPDGPGLSTMLFTGDSVSSSLGISRGTGKALGLYTYSGPGESVAVTMTIAANATFSGPVSGEDNNSDGIRGTVFIFTDEFALEDINAFEEGADLSCLFECYSPDFEITVELNTGIVELSGEELLNLSDGDQFYLYAFVTVASAGGGAADAGDGVSVTLNPIDGLTSVPGGGASPDADLDGVPDDSDNCTLLSNADQRDTNGDGYGNICDPDFDNNGIVNFLDISSWIPFFNTACGDVDEDINGDGGCNFGDFSTITQFFNLPPGPSGVAP